MFVDLRSFLHQVEASGNLVHFAEELSTEYEIAAATRYISEHLNKTVIFDKVKGYDIPIVTNLFGVKQNVAIAFGVTEDKIEDAYMARSMQPVKPRIVDSAPVQEVVVTDNIDIRRTIPILTHHEKDAGAYMTSAITIVKDPETGLSRMGLHRIQVKDKDTLGICLSSSLRMCEFLYKAQQKGEPLEIAIASGVDPFTFFAAVFYALEKGIEKFNIAGGLAQAPLELVKCRSVDVEVPANAEFILEGYILPGVREKEGPFGESSGYYLTYNNPVSKIKTITHRSKPIYHGLTPFGPEDQGLLELMTRPLLTKVMQDILPDVKVRGLSLLGTGEMCIVQIDNTNTGAALKVIDFLLQSPLAKIAIVVDSDVDISQIEEVAWAVATRVRPDRDIVIKSDLPGFILDPSLSSLEQGEFGSMVGGKNAKMGIDATKPLSELDKFEKVGVPPEVEKKISRLMEVIK